MKILVLFLIFFTQIFSFELQSALVLENKIEFKTDAKNFEPYSFTHEKLVNCEPKIEGISEFVSENSFIIYPKNDLIAGIKYACKSGKNEINFESFKFELKELNQISKNSFRMKFSDFVSKDELQKNLKIYSQNETLPFEISTTNEKEFFVKTKQYEKIIIENLSSKNGILLEKFVSNQGKIFKINPKASSLDDFIVKSANFDDGQIGFRMFFKNWIDASSEFMQAENIQNLSLKSRTYTSDLPQDEKEGISDKYWFCLEFASKEFKPNENYKITFLPGFGDNNLVLRDEKTFEIKAPNFKPFFKFKDDKKYVSKNVNVAYEAINVPKIQVVLEKIKSENYRYFLNYGYDDRLFTQILSKNLDLDAKLNEKSEAKFNINLENYEAGIYKLTIYFDKQNSVSKIFYLSDIAINAKIGNGGAFVYVNKISDLEKLDGAKVTIYSQNNEIIASGKSYDGVFKIEEKNFSSKKPQSIQVEYKKDRNFLILENSLNSGDINYNFESKNLALISLVSEILRPGDKLLGSVIFKKNDFSTLANLPVIIKILSPNNDEILVKKVKTDDFGVVILNEDLPKITGNYTIQAIFEDKILSTGYFSQEFFVPQRVKNEIKIAKNKFFKNEIIELNLSANYLFGGAGANLKANATLNLRDKNFLENYEDFSFSLKGEQNFLTDETKNFTLDENGKKNIIFKANLDKSNSQIIEAGVRFETLDGTKVVGANKFFNIFKAKQIVGIQALNDYVKKGEKAKFKTISLNVDDSSKADLNLEVEIYRQVWEYSVQNGSFKWDKIPVLESSLKNIKNEFSYEFKNGGDYEIVLIEPKQNLRASVEIFSSGFGVNTPTNEITKAVLKTNKKSYKPNDKVEISANSIVNEGVGLVTFSDTNVKIHKNFEIKNGEISGEFRLPKNFKGGYLSISLINKNSDKSGILRAYATKYLSLDNSNKKLEISYEIPKMHSNQKTSIKIKTKPKSRVILYIADDGILQIYNHEKLDSFNFFNQNYFNSVLDYDFYDFISKDFKKYKVVSFGGGDAVMMMKNSALKRFSDPINNQNVKNFIALKDGISDEMGEISFDLEIPNGFNSQINFNAIAINDDQISNLEQKAKVSDEIVIKPGAILYALQGDELEIPLNLINTTQDVKNFDLKFEYSQNLSVDLNQTKFSIKPQKTANSKILLKANKTGESFINFAINNHKYTIKFDVISPYNLKISTKSGIIKDHFSFKPKNQTLENTIEISSNPLSSVIKHSQDLLNFPYGSTLHKSAKILALLQMIDDLNGTKKDDAMRFIKIATTEILARMKNDGSFGIWSEVSKSDDEMSIFAIDTILSSKITKNLATKNQLSKMINYLKNAKFDSDTNKINVAYILAKNKNLDKSSLNFLFDNKIYEKSMANLHTMYAILDIFGLENEKKIVQKSIKKYDGLLSMDDLIQILQIYGDRKIPNDKLSNSVLELVFADNSHFCVKNKALILRALKSYLPNKKSEFSINLNGVFSKHNAKFNKTIKNLTNLEVNASEALYFSIISYEKSKPKISHKFEFDKFQKEGKIPLNLMIYREFVDENGKKVDLNKLFINQKIYSKITINDNFDGLFINEKVPACFEIVNEKIYGNTRNSFAKNTAIVQNQEVNDYSVTNFLEKSGAVVTIFTPYKIVLRGKCKLPSVVAQSYQNEKINAYDLSDYEFTIK